MMESKKSDDVMFYIPKVIGLDPENFSANDLEGVLQRFISLTRYNSRAWEGRFFIRTLMGMDEPCRDALTGYIRHVLDNGTVARNIPPSGAFNGDSGTPALSGMKIPAGFTGALRPEAPMFFKKSENSASVDHQAVEDMIWPMIEAFAKNPPTSPTPYEKLVLEVHRCVENGIGNEPDLARRYLCLQHASFLGDLGLCTFEGQEENKGAEPKPSTGRSR